MKKFSTILKKFGSFAKTKKGIAIIAAIIIVVIIIVSGGKKENLQQVAVTKGTINETVSITGNTSPVESVDLSFGSSGIVSRVDKTVGTKVTKGQLIAQLNSSDLGAQANQAQANLAAQQAKLEGIQAGSRPEDIASSQAALDKAKQDLDNLYASITDTSNDSYAKANDAVRAQIDPLFYDDETQKPQLTYSTSSPVDALITRRIAASVTLNSWQTSGQESQLSKNISDLSTIRTMLDLAAKSLDQSINIDATTLAAYKAAVTAATSAVNLASKNLNTLSQNISSQKLTINQLQAQLDLKRAGSTPQDISAQMAQVASAQAALQSAYAKLSNNRIVSPINGVITKIDAKVGQLATTGTPLVSIISDSAFEVNALISEIDIGKVAIDNSVSMTLDAFPSETFAGTVFYIDPAQTSTDGVVGYKIKISFDTADPRMKSGLTANIDIKTRSKENVLILPQYAILQNDDGVFVQVLDENKKGKDKTVDLPVTLGLQDQDGNVEITSGVSEGQQVVNIGLKQK
ncbi:MAG: efflux RND transporter periplasmic adaptor subunit [Candidatus Pacebacteria bacterium]|nr:efflux RND transporter periplasmic adaptor subunit [Candidatus Paceibacterota bacterium]MBP9851718.1 efflux RND transporter periplasmic adaptor subunit [Candidatus Paceibacterota bacterium]